MGQRPATGLARSATRSLAPAALLASLAALLATCATAPKLEPPKVSITGLKVVSAEVWVQHLQVRLQLHNPNDRELPVKALEYTIEIAGQNVGDGSYAQSFVVPAHGDVEVESNVTTNLAGALLKLVTHVPRTLIPYRVAGKVILEEGLGRIEFQAQASFIP